MTTRRVQPVKKQDAWEKLTPMQREIFDAVRQVLPKDHLTHEQSILEAEQRLINKIAQMEQTASNRVKTRFENMEKLVAKRYVQPMFLFYIVFVSTSVFLIFAIVLTLYVNDLEKQIRSLQWQLDQTDLKLTIKAEPPIEIDDFGFPVRPTL